MKRLVSIISSPWLTAAITFVLVFSIATATFIENDFGSQAARSLVYNAWWFDVLWLFTAFNLVFSMFTRKLFTYKKITILVFHAAFLIMLIGAAITRFNGFEGSISIREGTSQNKVLSENTYLVIQLKDSISSVVKQYKVNFKSVGRNRFNRSIHLGEHTLWITSKAFIPNAVLQNDPEKANYGKLIKNPDTKATGYDALLTEITWNGEVQEVILWGKNGLTGRSDTINKQGASIVITYGSIYNKLPFELKLNDFIVEHYSGSKSPSWFESIVTVIDPEKETGTPTRIYMNHILKYRGYRFYQSSYDMDEKGTILSVNHDWMGTLVTYAGYFLLGVGLFLNLFNRNSRFRKLSRELTQMGVIRKGMMVLFFVGITAFLTAQEVRTPNHLAEIGKNHASLFGRLLVQDNNGRIEPLNTLSSEILRKLYRSGTYKGMTPDQVVLGMFTDPAGWQSEPLIIVTHPAIKRILHSEDRYVSFASFFKDNRYILSDYVDKAYAKKPALRDKLDTEIIRLDERVNIAYLIFTGDLLKVLPIPDDSTHTWYSYQQVKGKVRTADSVFLENVMLLYISDINESKVSGNWTNPDRIIQALSGYQEKYASSIIPSKTKIALEILMNKADVFSRIARLYGVAGIVLLLLQLVVIFSNYRIAQRSVKWVVLFIIILFLIHTAGLALRWAVSGHAPWSNGYEALIYISWATMLAGLVFAGRSSITLSLTSILSLLILNTAHLSWMDPQITQLVPVLKSYWLVLHVATIMAGYGFLALGGLLAVINMVLMVSLSNKNHVLVRSKINELSVILEMNLIIGLSLLTLGTFLGGIWANTSWGRYWGWDPKESWALISIMVYAFVIHMKNIPRLKGRFALNLGAIAGIASLMMTYFGVNYYLSGLHSYVSGDPVPVPSFIGFVLAFLMVLVIWAHFNYRKMAQLENHETATHDGATG